MALQLVTPPRTHVHYGCCVSPTGLSGQKHRGDSAIACVSWRRGLLDDRLHPIAPPSPLSPNAGPQSSGLPVNNTLLGS